MRKFIIWLRINWIKVTLIILFICIALAIGLYISYIASNFKTLENFTKRQSAGMMAMYMPMFIFSQLLVLPASFAMMWFFIKAAELGESKRIKLEKMIRLFTGTISSAWLMLKTMPKKLLTYLKIIPCKRLSAEISSRALL